MLLVLFILYQIEIVASSSRSRAWLLISHSIHYAAAAVLCVYCRNFLERGEEEKRTRSEAEAMMNNLILRLVSAAFLLVDTPFILAEAQKLD